MVMFDAVPESFLNTDAMFSTLPFVTSGDVILTFVGDEITVTRLYDAGGGVFGIGEELLCVIRR